MTEEKHSPIVRFRVNKEVQDILDEIKTQNRNISQFIRESIQVNSIAKKFVKLFSDESVASGIPDNKKQAFMESFSLTEEKILDLLFKEVNQ